MERLSAPPLDVVVLLCEREETSAVAVGGGGAGCSRLVSSRLVWSCLQGRRRVGVAHRSGMFVGGGAEELFLCANQLLLGHAALLNLGLFLLARLDGEREGEVSQREPVDKTKQDKTREAEWATTCCCFL